MTANLSCRTLMLLLIALCSATAFAQGPILQCGGPVNRGMGGAGVAAPIDSIGAMYWNPASISGLKRSETAFGFGLLFPNHEVSSSVGGFSGSTEADNGAFPVPNFAWVHKTENEAVTLGFALNTVAGFGTNLPADATNPVLAPPAFGGLGNVASNAQFLQLAPVVSLALTDQLSVAAGPTLTTARIAVEPFVFGSANADGSYSTATATRYHWGGGFQLGAYYIYDEAWRFGASLKSPTWMEGFEANGVDENGLPRSNRVDVDLPLILSVGTSYDGWENLLLALDVRFLDFANTDGFGDPAYFDATGALNGLDYSSVVSVAGGVQCALTDRFFLRGGYTYNQNPIKNSEAFYNIASPLMFQHMLSCGTSYDFTDSLSANLAYSYAFENTRTGQVILPGIGGVPGSTFENKLDVHLFSFGLTVRH
ncbi:MAG: outer membrane protein transport protein [bacterium]|nr:outer membrane protein transport protein [bacterium]